LAVAAIGAAVALPVVLVAVGGGVSSHELHALESAGYQIVVSAAGGHGVASAHNLSQSIRSITGVAYASPDLTIAVDAFNASGIVSPVLAEGVIPSQFTPTLGPTQSGLFPNPLPLGDPNDTAFFNRGAYSGPPDHEVVVSAPYAQQFGVLIGSEVTLSPDANASSGVPYTVTGIFGPSFSFLQPTAAYAIVLPLSGLQALTGYAAGPGTIVPDAADSIEVALTPSAAANPQMVSTVAAEIQALVPYYTVSTLSQQVDQLESASAVLTGFYLALSSVGIAVGVVFLTLVLLRRVEADRRAIGIRRALGVPAWNVASGIVLDGAMIAGGGAVAGVVGGVAIVAVLRSWASSAVQEAARLAVFDPLQLGAIVVGILGLSVGASAVAVRTALRLEIAEALR
jgi:ABC-type lipoprotein release transport system permease subunit